MIISNHRPFRQCIYLIFFCFFINVEVKLTVQFQGTTFAFKCKSLERIIDVNHRLLLRYLIKLAVWRKEQSCCMKSVETGRIQIRREKIKETKTEQRKKERRIRKERNRKERATNDRKKER